MADWKLEEAVTTPTTRVLRYERSQTEAEKAAGDTESCARVFRWGLDVAQDTAARESELLLAAEVPGE